MQECTNCKGLVLEKNKFCKNCGEKNRYYNFALREKTLIVDIPYEIQAFERFGEYDKSVCNPGAKFEMVHLTWLLREAMMCITQGTPEWASKSFDDFLNVEPNNIEALRLKAQIDFFIEKENTLPNFHKVRTTCDKILKIDPNNIDAFDIKTSSYRAENDLGHAILCYQQILAIDPKNTLALREIIIIWIFILDPFKDNFRERTNMDVMDQLAKLGISTELGLFEIATSYCDKLLEIDPMDDVALINKGNAYFNKDYQRAISFYEKVLEKHPKFLRALFNIGSAYFVHKEFENAILWYDKALEIEPENKGLLSAKNEAIERLKNPIHNKISN